VRHDLPETAINQHERWHPAESEKYNYVRLRKTAKIRQKIGVVKLSV
jgi:hypothetical protein